MPLDVLLGLLLVCPSAPNSRRITAAGFCMGAEDFAYVSAVNRAAAASLGVWDRLGPVTKQVFQAFPEVRLCRRHCDPFMQTCNLAAVGGTLPPCLATSRRLPAP